MPSYKRILLLILITITLSLNVFSQQRDSMVFNHGIANYPSYHKFYGEMLFPIKKDSAELNEIAETRIFQCMKISDTLIVVTDNPLIWDNKYFFVKRYDFRHIFKNKNVLINDTELGYSANIYQGKDTLMYGRDDCDLWNYNLEGGIINDFKVIKCERDVFKFCKKIGLSPHYVENITHLIFIMPNSVIGLWGEELKLPLYNLKRAQKGFTIKLIELGVKNDRISYIYFSDYLSEIVYQQKCIFGNYFRSPSETKGFREVEQFSNKMAKLNRNSFFMSGWGAVNSVWSYCSFNDVNFIVIYKYKYRSEDLVAYQVFKYNNDLNWLKQFNDPEVLNVISKKFKSIENGGIFDYKYIENNRLYNAKLGIDAIYNDSIENIFLKTLRRDIIKYKLLEF